MTGMATNFPKITVLMPVYNGAPYLNEAMESILQQSFTDFEFLIINDGSTDASVRIINSYTDHRIRLIENPRNIGLVYTLNRGIDLAKGEFLARMDCDDISLPERLAKQLTFMERHLEVGACGSWVEYFMGGQLVLQLPINDAEIKRALPLYNPMAHPAVMIRTAIIRSSQLYYDPEYKDVEDYEFWTRLATITCFANLPEILLKYRIHPEQIGRRHSGKQAEAVEKLLAKLYG
jgi:glycosyltransferase involved in cell wall biosynthesis